MEKQLFDVANIGGGSAGLNAALVLGSARKKVAVIDEGRPRNAVTRKVHGFLTRDGIMGYLLHLLYLKGYAYESLITREVKTTVVSKEAALQEVPTWLGHHRLPVDERSRNIIADYLEQVYPSGKVVIQEGGRFGKVLIRLQDQNMNMREN